MSDSVPAMITQPRLMMVGGGACGEAAASMARIGVSRPLIVTDAFIHDSGMLARLTDGLDDAEIAYEVFADTVPDPTTEVVDTGADVLRAGNFDSMIAIGGGSPIDTAKAMGVLATHGGQMHDYKVPAQVDSSDYPIVAIPTTAGTGSEVTRFTVITNTETDEKMLCMGLGYVPVCALIDYTLSMTMPLRLTADTGIDTLTHAIEAYVSKKQNPFADSMALSCMRLVAGSIRTACATPDDAAAREAMMLAATQGGLAFSNASVCLVHGMSRPIGAHFHVPHGLSNAMLLPAVTAFSAPQAVDRYADCARAMSVADAEVGDQAAVAMLVEELRALNAELEVPSPEAYGIDADKYRELTPTMAKQALASGSPGNNPRVPSAEEIVSLYEEVWA
ncbi:MAG: iron-containing alcohol dehydrogenase [Alphaproteobacteria bacterium]|jgi:alcohol dehydrogenase class IV|nr:iron-containing alcohol dehydrogenase [Alphaproteobacteria bacterium]MDP6237997.1 iron-containing alcohol dehydrogenase [Alphaproteobacteria bacterium]MDP7173623.1 iron-containing alcohol dehydrogenase [Alphaproteobacteria bacterium]MDP7234403.1 iron-containing alcohol dehydrogenase [Alphaproteobacteria bacterium]